MNKQAKYPPTPKAARAASSMFYFNGKRCPKGHISPRYASTHGCLECLRQITADKREATKARRAARALSPRQIAQRDGFSRYNSGKPCPRGHRSDRLTINGVCVACMKEDRDRREAADPTIKERQKEYRKANAERYRTHVRNRRAAHRASEGTHTADDIEAIFKAQKGRCAYCRMRLKKNGKREWHVTIGATSNVRKWKKDEVKFARENGLLI